MIYDILSLLLLPIINHLPTHVCEWQVTSLLTKRMSGSHKIHVSCLGGQRRGTTVRSKEVIEMTRDIFITGSISAAMRSYPQACRASYLEQQQDYAHTGQKMPCSAVDREAGGERRKLKSFFVPLRSTQKDFNLHYPRHIHWKYINIGHIY